MSNAPATGSEDGSAAGAPAQQSTRDQVIVGAAALLWLAGTAVGSGLFGAGVSAQAGGLFSDHATLIAPKGPAFSIWGVIYLGLLWYVVWQFLPGHRTSPWARGTRLPAAASLALNGLWLLVVQAGIVWLSVLVMVGIVVALKRVMTQLRGLEAPNLPTLLAVPVTFGLYLGWICVATCANIASFLVGVGVPVSTPASVVVTLVVLAVVVAVVAVIVRSSPHPAFTVSLCAAVVWGLAWVSAGRLTGELHSGVVGYTAAGAALAVLGVALLVRAGRGRALEVPTTG